MTTFSSTYDTATPAGSDDPAEADDRMREIKAATQERENVDHYWPLTGTEVSDADTGEHRKVLFHAPIAATPTVAADHGDLRIKDVANGSDTLAELVFTNESEEELQLSSSGNNLANNVFLTATNAAGTGSVNVVGVNASDEVVMGTSVAPTVDAGVANKKYVDDNTKGDTYGTLDSVGGTLVKATAYTTQVAGFVSANVASNTGTILTAKVAGTTIQENAVGSGTVIRPSVFFFVPAGLTFQLDNASVAVTIRWCGLVSGGGLPVAP